MGRAALLSRLQREIDRIEDRDLCFDDGPDEHEAFSLGEEGIDEALGGGLRQAALHEVMAAHGHDRGAACGFLAALAIRRLAAAPSYQKLLWCLDPLSRHEQALLYPPGLEAFGLNPQRVILIRADRHDDALWALEEGINSGALAAVVGEIHDDIGLLPSRRLALAAAAKSTSVFLMRPPGSLGASAARSRWQIAAAPSAAHAFDRQAPGKPRFLAHLSRLRGGRPAQWCMEWNDATHAFAMVAPVVDRSARRALKAAPSAGGEQRAVA